MTAPTPARRPGVLTGTIRLVRLALRTGWPGLLGAVVLAAGLVTLVAGSIEALYPDPADRAQYAATVGSSPASEAFNGRGYGLHTVGGISAYEVGFMGQILFPVLALHLALRHTRREEEAGRTELLTAGRVGRLAPLVAGTAVLTLVCLLTGAAMAAGGVSAGLPLAGAAWYAAGNALLMLFYGAVGLVAGQLAQSARTGYLIGLVALAASYLVRALVDGLGWDAVWASPLGWTAEVRPFADPRPWPLAAFAVGAVVLSGAAVLLARRRDLGAGVVPPRRGPARGRRGLGTAAGLAWRLNRGVVLAWTVLAVVWAGVFGALTQEMADLVDANPAMLEALGVERGSDVVTSLAVVVVILAATALAVQGFGRLGVEETQGRLGAVLATRVPRHRLWGGWSAVVALASLASLTLGCLTLGLVTWAVTDDRDALGTAAEVGLGYAVPVLFVVAVVAVLRAVGSRWSGLGWLLVGWIAVVGFLAETLRIPDWARELSPLHLVGTLPQDDADLLAVAGLAVAAVILAAGSILLFGRRDLAAG
ncbi:ABC transporter permease [Georgenia deserti]|uniref:ABC transporter permease n=1 Tax=Georgenia deserti TaxID=2093781 RepID=A0ABW4L832_9MICO